MRNAVVSIARTFRCLAARETLGVGPFHTDSYSVLFVADVLQPIHDLAVESLLNRDMSHGRGRCCSMPMFLAGCKPNHISGMDFLNRTACPLGPSAARRDNQSLSQGMGMPSGTRSRLKRNAGTRNNCGVGCLKKRVNTDSARKPVCRTCARGLRTNAFDFHTPILWFREARLSNCQKTEIQEGFRWQQVKLLCVAEAEKARVQAALRRVES